MKQWIPPPDLFLGRTVAILAGGPSLTLESAQRVKAMRWRCIAVNNSFRHAPWAEVLYAADAPWWHVYAKEWAGFEGHCVVGQKYSNTPAGVYYYPTRAHCLGGNGALHAAHLALDLGASRIILLGVDLHASKLTHHHGKHPSPLSNPTARDFTQALKMWKQWAATFKGVTVLNCNPNSVLAVFPRVSLDSVTE